MCLQAGHLNAFGPFKLWGMICEVATRRVCRRNSCKDFMANAYRNWVNGAF
jgi:hypothetical protein